MNQVIKEYEDRWVLQPMRGSRITAVEWRASDFELIFDSQFGLAVGYGAELSHKSLAEDDPDRHAITHWPTAEIERYLDEPITSAVCFKSGSLRIGFRNGWKLFVSDRHPEVVASILFDGREIWNRSGLASDPGYPVLAIDPWTGEKIQGPPWPPRPDDYLVDYDSDDINGSFYIGLPALQVILARAKAELIDSSDAEILDVDKESYSKPHVIEKKNSPRAASYVSR